MCFTDGSSSLSQEQRRAGYAIVSPTTVIEMGVQKAEFIALTRALLLTKDLRVIIYTDSKYAHRVLRGTCPRRLVPPSGKKGAF